MFLRAARLGKVVLHIGLAMVQGARHEHGEALEVAAAQLNQAVTVHPLRTADDVPGSLDAVVLPGGESTTMRLATASGGLLEALFTWMESYPDRPVLGTCAGAILMAMPGEGRAPFLEVDVQRNGWGRQRRSFEADVNVNLDCPAPSTSSKGARSTLEGHTALPVGGRKRPARRCTACSFAPLGSPTSRAGARYRRLEGEPVGVLDGARLALTCHPNSRRTGASTAGCSRRPQARRVDGESHGRAPADGHEILPPEEGEAEGCVSAKRGANSCSS